MSFIQRLANPSGVTFVASSLLSIIAIVTGNLNRDGMLYVEAARAFLDDGVMAATSVFSWPFLPILMGGLAKPTGLSPELGGHILNVLFMAGASALLINMVDRSDRKLAWLSALVILSLPGLNQYRNELIREYGAWFFIMLTFWTVLDWPDKPSWWRCLAIQLSMVLAALFRPEALAFFASIVVWQHFQPARTPPWRRTLMLSALPAIGLIAILVAHYSGALPATSRISNEIARFDFSRFDETARGMAQAFNFYARDVAQSAHTILFFGSLAIIPWKLIWKFGLYTIPLVYFFVLPERKTAFRKYRLFQLAIICHLLVLSVFVLQQQFISGRYYGPLLIFAVPFVAIGLNHWLSIRPKWQWPIVVVGIALAMNNVVSLKAGNQHFSEAGHWLSSQIKDGPRIYLESARAAHYAGWKFSIRTGLPDRAKLLEEIKRNDFDVVVLETSRKEPSLADWISLAGLQEIRRFTDDDGDAVIVYVPLGQPFPPAQPSTTPSKREKTTSAE